MKSFKFLIWIVLLLLLGAVSLTLAAPSVPEGITAYDPQDRDASTDTIIGIDNVGSSTLSNVTPAYLPVGSAFDMCFTVFVQSPDAEYMDHFDVDLPDGWAVNSVATNSVPPANGCGGALPPVVGVDAGNVVYWQSAGYPPQTGCGAWNGTSIGTNFDFCTNITITDASGAPWTLPWNYIGDAWGSTPHQVSGSYGPIEPDIPLWMTPGLIEESGCPCGPQDHELMVKNFSGYDTLVNLSYSIISGAGTCSGPPSVYVPDGASYAFTVNFIPAGQPGDTVTCEVVAVDDSNPDNNAMSSLVKHLISGGFDPGGWQLEPIATATPNQWAGGTVGTNPAATGAVGYVVGGLAGTSVLNPDLQMYNPGAGTWTQLTDLPNPRFSPVVGWIGGLLYAAGGFDASFVATNDLQVYNPGTNTWDNTTPANLPASRGGGAGGVGTCSSGTGACLFHVGGGPDGLFANTTLETWEYNPGLNNWTQLDDKPAGSSLDGHILGTGVGCQGDIFVGGDYRGFHDFFRFDATQPTGSQWTQLATIPAAAGAMTPALVCMENMGALMLIGGDPDGSWSNYNNTVYVYDIATDTWDGPLPQTLNVAQLGSVGWNMDDKVWTAGGTIGSGAISPMPFESLEQIMCDLDACYDVFDVWKDAPTYAGNGDVFPYTININTQYLLTGFSMVDPLPDGVEFAENLNWNIGDAWYDPGENAVHWSYFPVQQIASPAVPVPLLPPDPDATADLVGGHETTGVPVSQGMTIFNYPNAMLWDNGPIVTHPGECSGVDASRLQTDLGMNILGFGNQYLVGNHMADDFEITNPLGWQIDQITFFAYQTNAPSDPSPITGVYYQIWDGPPNDPASKVVFGDLSTNRLVSSTFTNIQRDSGTSPCANNRYIFADVASAGVILPPGIYWIDWMTDGSLSSGPWAPPITILGETTTGNALQYTTISGAWAAALDSGTGTQQGMPFIIEGEPVPPPEITFEVTVTGHCGDVIANEVSAGFDGVSKEFTAATLVGGEALISISPSPLDASVCADTIGVETLSICNVGDCPLSWQVEELPPATLAGSMPFVPVDTTSKGIAPDEMSVSSPASNRLAEPAAVTQPEAVLWDQPLSTIDPNAWVDQEFPDFPSYSSFLADDFSNAEAWLVNNIFVPGNGWSSFSSLMNATALTWQIYADNGSGVPNGDPSGGGNPPIWTLTLPPLDPHVILTTGTGGMLSDVTLNPAVPIILPPGDWWLVFYPTMEFSYFGQYGRQPADTTNGYVAKFINPGGGFGLGTNWQDWTVLGPTQQDIAFRLEGIMLPEMGAISWMSQSPVSGTIPWGECQDVEVTFDATGLVPGDYTGELIILSNDLNDPATAITARLKVPEPVYGAAMSWTPTTPFAGTPVDFTSSVDGGSAPFTYSWDFGDGESDSGMNVSHVYMLAGTYFPELVVENACGISSASGTLTVQSSTTYLPIVMKRY